MKAPTMEEMHKVVSWMVNVRERVGRNEEFELKALRQELEKLHKISPCMHCSSFRYNFTVNPSPSEPNATKALLMTDEDGTCLMLLMNNRACGFIDVKYCPNCGRKLEEI
jgi:hypothetical protein